MQSVSARSLSVIVPARNESDTVARATRNLIDAVDGAEVVVVDDGSTDETFSVADSTVRTCDGGRVVRNVASSQGKGASIRTGLQLVSRPLVVIQDADLEYNPSDLSAFLEQFHHRFGSIASPLAVFGRRVSNSGSGRRVSDAGVRTLNHWVRFCGGVHTADHATCYKMMPTRILRLLDIQAAGFDWCGEVCVKLGRLATYLGGDLPGPALVEVPVSYTPRTKAEGKKLRLWHGWPVARTIWRWRNWTPPGPREAIVAEVRRAFAEVQSAFSAER